MSKEFHTMQTRPTSVLQNIADHHPIIFLFYHWLQGKFSDATLPSKKARSTYENSQYKDENGDLVARLMHHQGIPVFECYTNNVALKATAQGTLTAKAMIKFYLEYIQYLPIGARINTGTYFTDPNTWTTAEIKRRELDFSFIETELHYMLKAFNQEIARHNLTAISGLQLPFFSMNDMQVLISLCDVYKGMACSAATYHDDGANYLVRNLDWTSLCVLGSNTLATITHTKNTDTNKPQAVFSLGFTPGVLGLSMANDKGLVITLNEATKHDTKRENTEKNAIPQFILVRQLIENCTTIAEAKAYLKTHQPATSHILTMMDKEGSHGVFEMLPNKGDYADALFHFRGVDIHDHNIASQVDSPEKKYQNIQVVSNHFLDKTANPIYGSEGFDCSFTRYNNMKAALMNEKSAIEVAQSSSVSDTVHTLIFKAHEEKLSVLINIANAYSAQALDENEKLNYSSFDLTSLFKEFLTIDDPIKQSNLPDTTIDDYLLNLFQEAKQHGQTQPKLAQELINLYTALCHDVANQTVIKNYFNSLDTKTIIFNILNLLKKTRHATNQADLQTALEEFQTATQQYSITNRFANTTSWPSVLACVVGLDLLQAFAQGDITASLSFNMMSSFLTTLLTKPAPMLSFAGIVAALSTKLYPSSNNQHAFFSPLIKNIREGEKIRLKKDHQQQTSPESATTCHFS